MFGVHLYTTPTNMTFGLWNDCCSFAVGASTYGPGKKQ